MPLKTDLRVIELADRKEDIAFLISPGVTIAGLKRIEEELKKVNCYLYWGYEIELCDDGMYIEAVYPKGYDYRKFEEIEGLKIDYDAMDKWERDLE